MQVDALVDTGATFTILPANLLRRLGITAIRQGAFRLADDRVVQRDIGEAIVRVGDREVTSLVVFGEEGSGAILDAYSLEGLLLAVDPAGKRLVPAEGLLM